ncbi:MAG: EAL domain-containing protein [Acidovorax sp.]|uniref:sensor domain-containing protein n=1 Tax=Acidovorax sp. TaxID=1872122 RepID=UPI0039E5643F
MAPEAALAVGLLVLIVPVLAMLRPAQMLHPSRSTQLLVGLTGGLVSVLVLAVMQFGEARYGVFAYPTATAFVGLYFGPLAAATTAALALAAMVLSEPQSWLVTAAVLATAASVAAPWRRVDALPRPWAPWLAMAGATVTLPLAVALCLLAVVGAPPAMDSAKDWLAWVPWHHSAGFLILALGRQLLVGRAQTKVALERARHTLQERDQELHLTLDALGAGRWEWDIESRRWRCSGQFYETFGITPADMESPELWQRWYARRHPVDAERNAARLSRNMEGEEGSYEAEFRVLDTTGRWRWVMTRGMVGRRDAQGRPASMVGMDVDITAHREAEDALRASEAKYTTFYQVLPDPAAIVRPDGRFIDANPAFCEVLGFRRGEVIGRTSAEIGLWTRPEERERVTQTYQRDGKVDRIPVTMQRRGGLSVPGLISARSVVIDGERCFAFVFHDMTEIQRASQELRALNGLLEQAGRLARLGAWEDTLGQGFVYWTDVCYAIHGMQPGAPLPQGYIDRFVAPPYRDALRAKLRQCIHERVEWSIEMELMLPDGRLAWVRALGEPLAGEDGRVTRMRGVIQDIDEAKRAEQRLRQSEERFSRIFQLVPYPMGLSHRSDGRYLEINPAWEDLLGIARDDAIGRTAVGLGIVSPQDRQRMIDAVDSSGQLTGYELRLRARSGATLTVMQSMRAIEFDGEPCWLFSVHDITDRKRSEERVREREELLSLTISAAALGLWDWNLQTGTVTGDSRWRALRGIASEDDPRAAAYWSSGMAHDDIGRITAELARHTANPGTPFDATWRVSQSGDDARWVRNLGKIVGFDAEGRPERMLGVALDVTPQREQEVLLQRLALYDALTGLPNRVHLGRRLQESMTQAREHGTQLGVAYLDLDGFKPVNDRLGHGTGDRLLVVVAGRLTRALRPLDCVARLGGDEFVILMPALESAPACERLLHRVMESISAPYTLGTERVVVTASIGYTMFPANDSDADTLLRHADQAMYAAKQAGRNRFHQFDAAQERALQAAREQGRLLRDALADAQFALYLQPRVDMRSGAVVGAEALSRWQHPQRGVVPPGEFLPLLEGTDLEITFGEWAIETALATLERLQDSALAMPVSVNVGAQHLQAPGFADWMARCLARHPGVPAHMVEIEITESAALYDLAAVAHALTDLRALGVTVSLDDFGTGYSSLTYLRRLPMDTLKIDQSFVHGMMGDAGDLAIVQGVIGLARSFGYHVIAEGVETVEQGQLLLQLGCTQAQGYCIARPMPLDAFIDWVRAWQPPAAWRQKN